jgi:hypothetical protein
VAGFGGDGGLPAVADLGAGVGLASVADFGAVAGCPAVAGLAAAGGFAVASGCEGAGTVSSALHLGQWTFFPAELIGAESLLPQEHSIITLVTGWDTGGGLPGTLKTFWHAEHRTLLPATVSGTFITLPHSHFTCMEGPRKHSAVTGNDGDIVGTGRSRVNPARPCEQGRRESRRA